MPHIYDNWEKLVDVVVQAERNRKLCYSESLSSVSSSDGSAASRSTRKFSFDLSSSDQLNEQAPRGGNSPSFATTSSASANIFNHVPKPPKMPSSSRFDKIFGAAIRFVTPGKKRPESRITNLPQDISAPDKPEIQSGYSAPTEIEVEGDIPTIDAHVLSYDELKEQPGNFGPRSLIAKGFHEKVYFAQLESGKVIALKVLDASSESDSNDEFLTKVSTALKFKHENVVEFLGHHIEDDRRILAYEFATMGTLHDALHGRGSTVTGEQIGPILDWNQRVRIAVDAARGLEYFHDNRTIHKDIRSINVLLFKDFKAKIAYIDLSTKDPDDSVSVNGDPLYYAIRPEQSPGFEYNAPESGKAGKLTEKSDVYSFGVVLLELLTGRKSFDKTLPGGQENLVTWATPKLSEGKVETFVDPKLMGEYPPKAAAKLAAVASQCVQYESQLRPYMWTVIEALQLLMEGLEAPAPGIDAHALCFNELKKQTYNYGDQAVIGESLYGKVYFAWLKTGKGVALKMLDVSSESDSNDEFLTKVSIVSRFKHENVVEFLGHHIENDRRILAYEFATMGTLHDALHGRKSVVPGKQVLDWRQRVRIAVDAARGLEYLHENAAIHKDIRSGNILLFDDFKAKIADINLSTKDFHGYFSPDPEFHYSSTATHPSFESHASGFTMLGHLTQESDVYNFGVVLLELLTGKSSNTISRGPRRYQAFVTWAKPRLSKDRVEGYVDRKLMGNYPPEAAAKFADVAAQCLQDEAQRRPDMRTVVKALQSLLEAPAPVIDACALPFVGEIGFVKPILTSVKWSTLSNNHCGIHRTVFS